MNFTDLTRCFLSNACMRCPQVWEDILQVMSVAGIITNCCIVGITSSVLPSYMRSYGTGTETETYIYIYNDTTSHAISYYLPLCLSVCLYLPL